MNILYISCAIAPLLIGAPVMAETPPASAPHTAQKAQNQPTSDTVTTGVARGRDRLDSATSTSILREVEIVRLGASSVGEILRDVPGIRSEISTGEGSSNISIRGLPISTTGAKFVQLQEDGLPVLEFGDLLERSADVFLRPDLNLAQVEVIRGGSASTFASNSPGGIINFVSKTGDVEGGAFALTTGLDYNRYRGDFDYGGKISDTLRFHIGGFFRQGEGTRTTGYDSQKGGQIKLNVTKTFEGGYIRFYGKYLDDVTPEFSSVPMQASGSNADPSYDAIASFDPMQGTIRSRYNPQNLYVGRNGQTVIGDLTESRRVLAKSFGIESQFGISGWAVTERFRYSSMSGTSADILPTYLPAGAVIGGFGAGSSTRVAYATGPQAGQTIANPAALNGNGLLALLAVINVDSKSLDNITNDIRASRIWGVAGGELTTTVGFYASRQSNDTDLAFTTAISEVRGDGQAALINLFDGTGRPITQDGYYSYSLATFGGRVRRVFDVDYTTSAPFASLNYHLGRVSVGASVRYDYGKAEGRLYSADLGGGRVGNISRDMNGDGVISSAETRVSVVPITQPAPVNYDTDALSYSTGINFRFSEPLAFFARYSQGARTNADRILFTPIVNSVTGELNVPDAAVDTARQAEGGVKYRRQDLTLNLTGFWAKVDDSNFDTGTGSTVIAGYTARGVEFEGAVRRGPFSLSAGTTYTDAEISENQGSPALVGNVPRHQPKFIFQATPQVTFRHVNIGAVFLGATDSYAQNTNQLKLPGYVTTNAFVQVSPTDRLLVTLNATNLFNTQAVVAVDQATIPTGGLVSAQLLNGRAVSLTARLNF